MTDRRYSATPDGKRILHLLEETGLTYRVNPVIAPHYTGNGTLVVPPKTLATGGSISEA
jgi:hypothetical protein